MCKKGFLLDRNTPKHFSWLWQITIIRFIIIQSMNLIMALFKSRRRHFHNLKPSPLNRKVLYSLIGIIVSQLVNGIPGDFIQPNVVYVATKDHS